MLQYARAFFAITAAHQVHIDACHKPGAQMTVPDSTLSNHRRIHLAAGHAKTFTLSGIHYVI